MTFDKAVERAQRAAKLRELRFAASAPIRSLVQQDKKALRALTEASEARKVALAALRGRSLSLYSQTFGPFPSWSLNLTPGLHVFSPPYDLDRPGPTTGSPTDSTADRDTGDFFASCDFDSNAHGFRAASASVIIIFQPSVIGVSSIVRSAPPSWVSVGTTDSQ